jgi:hypothetical protein
MTKKIVSILLLALTASAMSMETDNKESESNQRIKIKSIQERVKKIIRSTKKRSKASDINIHKSSTKEALATLILLNQHQTTKHED